MPDWQRLGQVDPKALREARIQAHYAAQRVSAPATVLLEKKPDWSHTVLVWNQRHSALVSQTLPSGTALGLRLPDLDMIELDDGDIIQEYELAGRSNSDVDLYLATHLEIHGVTAERLAAVTYSDMPEHAIAQNGPYDPHGLAQEFAELAGWFGNAASVLAIIRGELSDVRPGSSPVYCWPHHFDIATLVTLEEGDAEGARAIGIGMSPGDTAYDQPYFYVNPWPHLDPNGLPEIPEPGRWHTEGFVGAVATSERIVAETDQQQALLTFIREAVRIGREKLDV